MWKTLTGKKNVSHVRNDMVEWSAVKLRNTYRQVEWESGEVDSISSNCGCFTSPVWLQVSPSLPVSRPPRSLSWELHLDKYQTDTYTHTPVAPYKETAVHKQASWLPPDCFQFWQSPSGLSSLHWGLSKVYMKRNVLASVSVTAERTGKS